MMFGVDRFQGVGIGVVVATACLIAPAMATTAPGPHGAPKSYAPPQAKILSIETVLLGRVFASARHSDFTYSGSGRKIRVRYVVPVIETAVDENEPDRPVPVVEEQVAVTLNDLPALNPRAPEPKPVVVASVDQSPRTGLPVAPNLRALPTRKRPIFGPSPVKRHVALPRTMPEAPQLKRCAAAPALAGRHPAIPRSRDVRLAAFATGKTGEETRADRHPEAVAIAVASVAGNVTGAPPYIPWAVRQEQAKGFRAGPVHGNPHLAPHVTPFMSDHKPGTVVVHVKEKRLYLVQSASTARVYPIGTARGALDILGATRVTTRRFLPTWTPTPNQRRRDPTLPRRVEAGPNNPLGIRALGLGWRYRLIHGTSDPSSIGFARSDGCIRMLNDDVADLFNRVKVGNRVLVLASANAGLTEWRPAGYKEYKRRRRASRRSWRKKRRWRSRRYAAKRAKRRRRRR